MAKRNPSKGTGRRAASPKKNFSGKPDSRPRKSAPGKPYGDSPSKSFDSDKRERPRSNRKFDTNRSENSSREEKRPYQKNKSFSSSNFSGKPDSRPRKSGAGKPYGDSSSKPFGSDKTERPRSNRKFDTNRSENSSGEKKRPYEKNRNFSSSNSDQPRRKFDSDKPKGARPYKKFDRKDSDEKKPFKREGFRSSGPSTALRRESQYKKFDESSEPAKRKSDSSFSERKATESFKKAESSKGKVRTDVEAPLQTGKIRLNKFIANSGVCSRREADELIKMGIISVNGKTITELGYKVNPGDEVRHESQVLRAERPVYILMNKPKGFLTTTNDPQERNTVMHLLGNSIKERVYPVGRLDRNTTGLLLLTNDGDLADKLMHPSYNAKKIYKVELDRPLTKTDAQLILEGVQLEEGRAMVDDLAIISEDKKTVGLEIHIGWNRVVRRIFEALNYDVRKLDRSVYAGLDKKNLGRGEWRFLTKEELVRLKHYK
jgi:23S rRNA pseudouridine2605 synthase